MAPSTAIPPPPTEVVTKAADGAVVVEQPRPEPVSRSSFASTAPSTATRKSSFVLSRTNSRKSGKTESLFEGLPRDPAEVLIDRCRGWFELFDGLLRHFQDVAHVAKSQASVYQKTSKHWSTPNAHINAAFPHDQTPVPHLIRSLGAYSHATAEHHNAIAKTVHNSTIPAIKGLRKSVGEKMEELQDELKTRQKAMKKDAEKLKGLESRLVAALHAATTPGKDVKDHGDPFLANTAIKLHLLHSHAKFHAHTSTISSIQNTFNIFETNLTSALKTAIHSYTDLLPSTDPSSKTLTDAVEALDSAKEWEYFHSLKLAATESPQAFVDSAGYEGAHDSLVLPVKKGELKRKSKVLKRWKLGWAVLSSAGWLHLYDEEPKFVDSWDGVGQEIEWPRKSIWLRECSLAPAGKGKDGDIHIQKPQGGAFSKSKVYKFQAFDALAWQEAFEPFMKTIYKEYNYQGRWNATGATTSSGGTTATTSTHQLKRSETVMSDITLGPGDSISQVGTPEPK
ncbi:hypothetical protein HK097_009227 [Rhizophlyctis rosea]|uniref:PH domain-containing protein n=1 Tax=Rhizophlyctis rosea TaxID=64517 RepID=A0AAD5X403_9FUNG|nr:hypothetical protein HK097_009227 [Rhizophlyctis rosea]